MAKKKEPKTQKTVEKLSREEWLREVLKDIDPAKYAGEGWFATEEYAKPGDIGNPFTRAEVGREGDYYPGVITPQQELAIRKLLKRR